jgi:hypothetical protein
MPTLNTTPNQGYQLPFAGNNLSGDVARIIAAIDAIDTDVASALSTLAAKAGLASPAFTGTPTAPTATPGTDSGQLATTAFVKAALDVLDGGAPSDLNTFNKLAAAIGDDADYAASMVTALAGKVDVNSPQAFTAAQQGQARANIGAGALSGFRNKIINGDILISQRGASFSIAAGGIVYTADRWVISNGTSQTATINIVAPSLAAFASHGYPGYISISFSVAPTTGDVTIIHPVEYAKTLAGKQVTIGAIFYPNSGVGGQAVSAQIRQCFGLGGSPSATVTTPVTLSQGTISTGTTPSDIRGTVTLPSVEGKTLGTSANDFVGVDFIYTPRTTEAVFFTHAFFVEGDATAENDPFSPRSIQQEWSLCHRYYWTSYPPGKYPGDIITSPLATTAQGTVSYLSVNGTFPETLRTPPITGRYSPVTGAGGYFAVDGVDKLASTVFANTKGFYVYINNSPVAANQFASIHVVADAEL